MPDFRLPRLPDRKPVKMTISLPPELHRALSDYAELYKEVYGKSEPVQELIPAMLGSFLNGDRRFARRRRRQES